MSAASQGTEVAYIGLGSNLQDPAAQVNLAFERLDEIPDTELSGRSSLYRSAPFGPVEQPDFVNAVAAIQTALPALILLEHLQRIEREQGRVRGAERWGPRIIDLDLLVYGNAEIATAELTVPHPGIALRNFVLLPLRELAPDLLIPKLGRVRDFENIESDPGISRIS